MTTSTPAPATALRTLAAQALLGVARSGNKDASAALLAQAAVLGARARAGRTLAVQSATIDAMPPDPTPVASRDAMALLSQFIANDTDLIEEWARLANARGVRVDHAVVPQILDWWSRQPRRSPEVFRSLGVCGVWLASHNPDWDKPVVTHTIPPDADSIWSTGKTAERVALLQTIRSINPARARDMVASTWSSDSADQRGKFIEALGQGASMDDEPFAEAALDDRSVGVKAAAQLLLRRIPGSRLCQRMNERAKQMLVVGSERKGLLQRKSAMLAIQPPESTDDALIRDGLDPRYVKEAKGRRSAIVELVFSAANLSIWQSHTSLEPTAMLAALAKDDYFGNAISGLTQATQISRNPAWAEAILHASLNIGKTRWQGLQSLWVSLETPDLERILLQVLKHNATSTGERWQALTTHDSPWSAAFSQAAMRAVVDNSAKERTKPVDYYAAGIVSAHIHPSAIDVFETALGDPASHTDSIRRSLSRARLRADMHKEFAT